MNALRAMGYDGPVTVEPFMSELGDLPADVAVQRTAEALLNMMNATI